jgi:hypothetical protein
MHIDLSALFLNVPATFYCRRFAPSGIERPIAVDLHLLRDLNHVQEPTKISSAPISVDTACEHLS